MCCHIFQTARRKHLLTHSFPTFFFTKIYNFWLSIYVHQSLFPLLSLGTTDVIYETHFRFVSWHFILSKGVIYWTLYPVFLGSHCVFLFPIWPFCRSVCCPRICCLVWYFVYTLWHPGLHFTRLPLLNGVVSVRPNSDVYRRSKYMYNI